MIPIDTSNISIALTHGSRAIMGILRSSPVCDWRRHEDERMHSERVIPIDLLRTLLVLQENKSFSRTAELLGRSQSAISLQIRRLEELAGEPLFTSSGKALALTEQGRLLNEYAEQILKLNNECVARLSGRVVIGTIRVGIPSDFAITYLPTVLGRFSKAEPNISLDVQCELSAGLASKMRDRKLDLVLCLHEGEKTPEVTRTWRDPAVWVGSESHDLSQKRPLPLVLFPEGCQYRSAALQTLQNRNIPFRIVYSSPSMAGNQAAVQGGLGLTVLSRTSVPPYLKLLPDSPSLPNLGTVEIGLYWQKRGATKATHELARFLASALDARLGNRAQASC